MFANLFALFISDHAPVQHLPGAAFVLAALLLVVATLVAIRATRHVTPAFTVAPTPPEPLEHIP
jgi:DHA1 family tetracycline resistance protein-like MFS transporter